MKRGIITCLAAIAVLAVDGCKKPNAAAPDAANKAFQSAAPELKDAWASAVAADKTNGYADAYLTLLQMRHQTDLPPDQLAAIDALGPPKKATLRPKRPSRKSAKCGGAAINRRTFLKYLS
jgi:hypothetical protein